MPSSALVTGADRLEVAGGVVGDVAEESAVAAGVAAAAARGPLRAAVACAGVAIAQRTVGSAGAHSLNEFRRVIDVNVLGSFNLLRLAAAQMAANEPDGGGQRGVIVLTASIAAFEGQVGQVAYAASKGAIAAMVLPAARDLARHGIRVVAIAPGTFDTPLLAGLPEPALAALAATVPNPARLGRPDEFAALVAHVIANEMLNGTTIRLDGALRMPPR